MIATVGIKTLKRDRSGKEVGSQVVQVPGCEIWPRRSAEGEQGRIVLSGWNVYFPQRRTIPSDAELVVEGTDYALFGKVADYGEDGMIAQCRSVGDA